MPRRSQYAVPVSESTPVLRLRDLAAGRRPRVAAPAHPLFVAALAAALLAAGMAQPAHAQGGCTAEQGQAFIDEGKYKQAVHEFTCLINDQPTEVEGYRGRIEAELLLGRYSDAVRDYARVTAFVAPVHPDAVSTIIAGYAARLASAPDNIPALTGASFARWWDFQYASAIQVLNHLLDVRPDDLYGNLFRGSSRLLRGANPAGEADLQRALALAEPTADVHYVAADAYFYGEADANAAFTHASLALAGGLDTPRVHAILAGAYLAFGNMSAAATHIERHIELVTTELVTTAPIAPGTSLTLDLVPGRTYDIPVSAIAGDTIAIATSSHDFYDSIVVLLDPNGLPVVGNDDYRQYFAGFEWVAEASGTYRLRATSFESVDTGGLLVKRTN